MEPEWKYKLRAWLAVLLLLLLVASYVLEIQWFENTFGAGRLIVGSLATGLAAGSCTAFFLQKKARGRLSKIQLWVALLLLPTLFAPLVGCRLNRGLSSGKLHFREFQFLEEKPFSRGIYGIVRGETVKTEGYFIFLQDETQVHKLRSKTPQFLGTQRGETVKIPVRTGLFGLEVAQF